MRNTGSPTGRSTGSAELGQFAALPMNIDVAAGRRDDVTVIPQELHPVRFAVFGPSESITGAEGGKSIGWAVRPATPQSSPVPLGPAARNAVIVRSRLPSFQMSRTQTESVEVQGMDRSVRADRYADGPGPGRSRRSRGEGRTRARRTPPVDAGRAMAAQRTGVPAVTWSALDLLTLGFGLGLKYEASTCRRPRGWGGA
jgi:hypothetical protein